MSVIFPIISRSLSGELVLDTKLHGWELTLRNHHCFCSRWGLNAFMLRMNSGFSWLLVCLFSRHQLRLISPPSLRLSFLCPSYQRVFSVSQRWRIPIFRWPASKVFWRAEQTWLLTSEWFITGWRILFCSHALPALSLGFLCQVIETLIFAYLTSVSLAASQGLFPRTENMGVLKKVSTVPTHAMCRFPVLSTFCHGAAESVILYPEAVYPGQPLPLSLLPTLPS